CRAISLKRPFMLLSEMSRRGTCLFRGRVRPPKTSMSVTIGFWRMSQSEAGRFLGRGSTIPATILTDIPHDRTHEAELDAGERGLYTRGASHAVEPSAAQRLLDLARHARSDSVAYQSVAVAGVQVLERVLDREKAAAVAAL